MFDNLTAEEYRMFCSLTSTIQRVEYLLSSIQYTATAQNPSNPPPRTELHEEVLTQRENLWYIIDMNRPEEMGS